MGHDYDYDLIVIGAGPAGEKAAVQAAYFGKRVAIIEKNPEPGGAAVHTGTLPSKTLRETALYLSGHRGKDIYGISVVVEREHCAPRLLSRKDEVRRQEVARMRWNFERHGVTQLRGRATFVDAHTVEIEGGKRFRSDVFLIATGSTPFRPPGIDFDDPDVEDSDSVLDLDHIPESLTVIGAGVIGCEYATIFAALGVRVTVVEPRSAILTFLDHEIGKRLLAAMRGLGVEMILEDSFQSVARVEGRGIVTTLASGREVATGQFLFAAGRSGATANMGLEAIGVEIGKRGYLVVDGQYQTKVPHIYAAGDCIGFPALASTSMEQGRVAVCAAFGFDYKHKVGELLPYGIYTIPEVSCVGVSEEDAAERDIDPVIGRGFYRDNARGKIIGDRDGLVKLVFDRKSRKIVGCHCLGDRASELVHVGQMAIALGGTVDTFIDLVFNYPTLGETFKYAAYDALAKF